jgi:hypothetical protein
MSRVQRFSTTIILALLVWKAGPAAAETSKLAQMAPEETLVYVEVRNSTQLREAWTKTPFHALWASPECAAFWQPSKDKIKQFISGVEGKTSVTLEELKKNFPGEIAVFLSDVMPQKDSLGGSYDDVNTGIIARFSDKDLTKRLAEEQVLKNVPTDAERSSEIFKGIKIFRTQYREQAPKPVPGQKDETLTLPEASEEKRTAPLLFEYAFVGDHFILLEGQRAFMKKVLTNCTSLAPSGAGKGAAPQGSMAATAGFANALGRLSESPDVLAYVNLERYMKEILPKGEDNPLGKMPVLGLEELRSFALSFRLAPGRTEMDAILRATPSPKGIARFLIQDAPKTLRTQGMAPADAVSYGAGFLDVAGLYSFIRTAAAQSRGDSGKSFDEGMASFSEASKVNVAELISKVGGEIAAFTRPGSDSAGAASPRQNETVILVQLKEEQGFAESVAKLVEFFFARESMGLKVDSTDFKGFPLYSLKMDPAAGTQPALPPNLAPKWSFAVANSFLIMSREADQVKEALRRVTGEAGGDVTQNADFKKMVGSLQPGYAALSWSNDKQEMENLARTLQAQPMLMLMAGQYVQLMAMPSPETFGRYFDQSAMAAYVTPELWHAHSVSVYPKEFAGQK